MWFFLGYDDAGQFWRSEYTVDSLHYSDKDFLEDLDDLWNQIKPLYGELHAYVRRKLIQKLPDENLSSSDPIPAHLLGTQSINQWDWWNVVIEKTFQVVNQSWYCSTSVFCWKFSIFCVKWATRRWCFESRRHVFSRMDQHVEFHANIPLQTAAGRDGRNGGAELHGAENVPLVGAVSKGSRLDPHAGNVLEKVHVQKAARRTWRGLPCVRVGFLPQPRQRRRAVRTEQWSDVFL